MRQSRYDQTYRTTQRPQRAIHNVRVWGIVGVRDGKMVDSIHDPQLDVLYVVSCMGAQMIFTDGDEIWHKRLTSKVTRYNGAIGTVITDELGPTKVPPHQKGLIRTALKGYLEGAGNLLEFKGRYMKMKTNTDRCTITTKNGVITICDISRTIEKDKE